MEMKLWRTEEVGLFDVNFDTGEQYWSYEFRQILGVDRDVPAEFHFTLAVRASGGSPRFLRDRDGAVPAGLSRAQND